MTDHSNVFERVRDHLAARYEKCGIPDNRAIADYLTSTMQLPMFFSSVQVKLSDKSLISTLKDAKNTTSKIKFFLKSFISGSVMLIVLVLHVFSGLKRREKVHIVFSLTQQQVKSLNEIREFLSESRFNMRILNHHLILLEDRNSKQDFDGNTLLVRDSMCWLYMNTFTRFQKIHCLYDIFLEIFRSLLGIRRIRICLFRQLIIDKQIFRHAQMNMTILSLSTTQSHLQRLPISFYLAEGTRVPRYMFWYSDNSWVFERENTFTAFDHSRYKRDFIDIHFCWSLEWQAYLESFGMSSKIFASGSILFYSQETRHQMAQKSYDVLIFDVTPGVAMNEYDFYSQDALNSFYDGIKSAIDTSKARGLKISIKNKRKLNQRLDTWAESNRASMLDPNANLYELVNEARLVIGLPLVSPIRIAKELGVSCAYYYPDTSEEWILPLEHAGVPIFRKFSDLSEWISKNV